MARGTRGMIWLLLDICRVLHSAYMPLYAECSTRYIGERTVAHELPRGVLYTECNTRQTGRRRQSRTGRTRVLLFAECCLFAECVVWHSVLIYLDAEWYTRQTVYTPSARFCRVFFYLHSVKIIYAECSIKNTRQTAWHSASLCFPVVAGRVKTGSTYYNN